MAPATAKAKRKHETIDLTGEDDATLSSLSRNAPPSQLERDGWQPDDEHEAEDIIISSQNNNHEITATYQIYGVLDTKIVGVQYYRGLASNGEYVVVIRQPNNEV